MTRAAPRLALAATMLCLAACSAEPQRNAAAAKPEPATAPPAGAAATPTPPAPIADAHAKPDPGALKTFGDWAVGCDNTQRCQLRSLGPDLAPPEGVTVSIERLAGPAGHVSVQIGSDSLDDLDAVVDGTPRPGAAAIVAAMANGHAMAARQAGKVVATLSLKGAAAALRYVDAMQGRAGTLTATVARGVKPASAVPAAPLPPTIVAVAPSGTAAQPTPAQVAAMRRTATCEPNRDLGMAGTYALGRGKTLVLLPCSAGAYNLLQAIFVGDANGFAPVTADAPIGFAETGADSGSPIPTVVNGEFRDGVLTSYAKGRGLGDCGVNQELVWDGSRLRLSRQREMGECRGNPDYITTWRAEVVRRP